MRRSARHVPTSLQSNPSLIDSHGYACDLLTPHALGVWRGDEVDRYSCFAYKLTTASWLGFTTLQKVRLFRRNCV